MYNSAIIVSSSSSVPSSVRTICSNNNNYVYFARQSLIGNNQKDLLVRARNMARIDRGGWTKKGSEIF